MGEVVNRAALIQAYFAAAPREDSLSSSHANGIQERHDVCLETVTFPGKGVCRGKHLGGSYSCLAGTALHIRDVGTHPQSALRRLLHVARNRLGCGALLFNR